MGEQFQTKKFKEEEIMWKSKRSKARWLLEGVEILSSFMGLLELGVVQIKFQFWLMMELGLRIVKISLNMYFFFFF